MSFHGKKNIYLCKTCGHGVITKDVHEGTTPFSIPCVMPECKGFAFSMFYAAPQKVLAEYRPALEWYKPTPEQLATMTSGVQEHVRRGGLISRPTNGAVQ